MRTHTDLITEARRIEAIGEFLAEESRRASSLGRATPLRIIPTFLAAPAWPVERWMEAEMMDGAMEYRLVERDGKSSASNARVLCASDSAFDVLAEGDELEETESLTERLTPIVERIGGHEFDKSLEPSAVQEVAAMLDAGELDPAAQLRTKAEIIELLAGKLETRHFVAAVVGRRSHRSSVQESLTERCEQRLIQEL